MGDRISGGGGLGGVTCCQCAYVIISDKRGGAVWGDGGGIFGIFGNMTHWECKGIAIASSW